MSAAVPLVLFGWIPFVVLLFGLLKPRLAVGYGFALGWCFLPVAEYPISGLPDFTKTTATMWGILLGTALFHSDLIATFRPKVLDIPTIIWCICPLFSSLVNGIGWYDGQSAMLLQTTTWGIPYLIGRLHFKEVGDLPDLVWPIVVCAVLYVPLCWYEIRMSPQLHRMAYGFAQHSFAQTMRGGGWRPMVFMNHGLQVGMWMASSVVLIAAWYRFASQRSFTFLNHVVPVYPIALALLVTFLMVKSTGAIALAFVGYLLLEVSALVGRSAPVLAIAFGCVAYLGVRTTDTWTGEELVELAGRIDTDRAASLQFRIDNEDMLAEKALQHPIFGWGGWGRARIYDETGTDISTTDGLWIIALGNYGILGLASLYSMLLVGPSLLALRCSPMYWQDDPNTLLGAAVAVVCLLAAADSLPNAHQIPTMTMAIGLAVGLHGGVESKKNDCSPEPGVTIL